MIEPGPDFAALFRDFEFTAFRLETLDRYESANESDALRAFVTGERVDMGWFQSWLDMIRSSVAQGRCFSRVRVVSLPLTDYSRFGIFCSQFTNEAGEDIRYLARHDSDGLPDHDYWLFDSSSLLRMRFDDGGRFLGGELVDEAEEILRYSYWRDAARHRALRRDDFAAEQLGQRSPSTRVPDRPATGIQGAPPDRPGS